MNKIIEPSAAATSRSTALSRSSNSPRNFAPASSAPTSRDKMRASFMLSGQSPLIMRRAKPSAIAVLPTPGSPISTGLFFDRRLSTCMQRRISSSRPITGSIFPDCARSVRSMAYFFSASMPLSALGSLAPVEPLALRMASMDCRSRECVTPTALNTSLAGVLVSASANNKCSVLTYVSFIRCASRSASVRICPNAVPGAAFAPCTFGMRRSSACATSRTRFESMPARCKILLAIPFFSSTTASNKCRGVSSP